MELHLTIPSKTTDLSPKDVKFVSALFLSQQSESEFLVKAFLFFSGLKIVKMRLPMTDGAMWYRHHSLKKPFLIKPDIIASMAEKCRFLLSTGEMTPLPWIRFARARHRRLNNACFEEYLMAENYYFAYVDTKNETHLNNLISVLYRCPWQRWNSDKIQARSSRFAHIDPVIKNTVFLWYIGFRSYVPQRCKSLFSGKKSNEPFSPRNYINGMIHQLTNGDITVKTALLKLPVWDALDELEQRALEALRTEMAYSSNKKN